MMTKRNKVLAIGLVALVAATAVAFVVLAQTESTETTSSSPRAALIEKVAANLGVDKDALVAAFEKARIEMIDDAVVAGRITEEQAQQMKQGIEARQAMRDVLEKAVADGKITQEQLALLGQRGGRGMPGRQGFMPRGGKGPGDCGRGFMGPMMWDKRP
ncbi:MAG: DUF2680 domain-containing protein [Candidatus Bipolaricaulota bacterium]